MDMFSSLFWNHGCSISHDNPVIIIMKYRLEWVEVVPTSRCTQQVTLEIEDRLARIEPRVTRLNIRVLLCCHSGPGAVTNWGPPGGGGLDGGNLNMDIICF